MDVRSYLAPYGIDLVGVLPLCECRLTRPYLLSRAGFDPNAPLSVVMLAIPYLTPIADTPDRNLSAYAVSEDYHLFIRELFDELVARLRADAPDHRFVGFADHSPIDEIDAAVLAGLGVRGRNHLLLTERYSSYVFLSEIVTDLPLASTRTALPVEALRCHDCGACISACPKHRTDGTCLSALTQKKGELTERERAVLTDFPSVWGCDVCQEVCPYTYRARARGTIYSPIPFFSRNALAHLTVEELDRMSDEQFSRRAYAWRGRDTIRRNLLWKTPNASAASEEKEN